jgi:hypothetical protein
MAEVENKQENQQASNVKEVEVKTKKVSINPKVGFQYKFDDVYNENDNTNVNYKEFDFSVFAGMEQEIQEIQNEYQSLVDKGVYAKDFLADKRTEALINISDVKSKYRNKAKEQLAQLKNPEKTIQPMTETAQLININKRLNNNLLAGKMLEVATVEEMDAMYEMNKGNSEIRNLIRLKALNIYRTSKNDNVKNQVLRLKSAIDTYEQELKNLDYFNKLQGIEYTLDYVFNMSDRYPTGLEKGFENMKTKRLFE